MGTRINSYKDLIVWKRSVELAVEIYRLTESFPKREQFGLTAQMRRAAISIASNIAEGRSGSTRKEFRRFLFIAYASGGELETQIYIAKRLREIKELDYQSADQLLDEVMRMLNAICRKLEA